MWKMHFLCFLENKWSAIPIWDPWNLDAHVEMLVGYEEIKS